MPICAPVGGRIGAAMNGQNTGAWSDVIRYCGSGAYPVAPAGAPLPQPARRPQPREQLALGDCSGSGVQPLRQRLPVVGQQLPHRPTCRAALTGATSLGTHRALRDIFRPTPSGMAEAMNPESVARSSRCGVYPARRIADSSCRP